MYIYICMCENKYICLHGHQYERIEVHLRVKIINHIVSVIDIHCRDPEVTWNLQTFLFTDGLKFISCLTIIHPFSIVNHQGCHPPNPPKNTVCPQISLCDSWKRSHQERRLISSKINRLNAFSLRPLWSLGIMGKNVSQMCRKQPHFLKHHLGKFQRHANLCKSGCETENLGILLQFT